MAHTQHQRVDGELLTAGRHIAVMRFHLNGQSLILLARARGELMRRREMGQNERMLCLDEGRDRRCDHLEV